MPRAERLLALMQILRQHRAPVAGTVLAHELGISLRTLYRDIAALQAQGATVTGEAGVGYLLRPGFTLPPLMFDSDELEALVLGTRWVARRTDSDLAEAARRSLAKIHAVLPIPLRHELESNALLVPAGPGTSEPKEALPGLRAAIRAERKVRIGYRDTNGAESLRVVWPFAVGFFEQGRVLAAWCERREAFRHFRLDRISSLDVQEERYPRRRQVLLQEWRRLEGIELRLD